MQKKSKTFRELKQYLELAVNINSVTVGRNADTYLIATGSDVIISLIFSHKNVSI